MNINEVIAEYAERIESEQLSEKLSLTGMCCICVDENSQYLGELYIILNREASFEYAVFTSYSDDIKNVIFMRTKKQSFSADIQQFADGNAAIRVVRDCSVTMTYRELEDLSTKLAKRISSAIKRKVTLHKRILRTVANSELVNEMLQ